MCLPSIECRVVCGISRRLAQAEQGTTRGVNPLHLATAEHFLIQRNEKARAADGSRWMTLATTHRRYRTV